MYIGHFGFALAGKAVRRDAPLWLLVIATQGCDWAQVVACIAAPEGASAMWSHSIPAVAAIAIAVSLSAYLFSGDRGVAALAGAVAVSHLAADYVTGVKPTWPGGPTIGLDLYSRPMADLVLEMITLLLGWMVYRRSLPPEARSGRMTWALLVVLCAIQLVGAVKEGLLPHTPKCM